MFPTDIVVETSAVCNARCIMCPQGKFKRPPFMDDDEFCNIIDQCVGRGLVQVSFSFYGEPLMDQRLEERVAYVSSKLPETHIIMFTNGSLLTKERSEGLLNAGMREVIFSIDSLDKKTYESIRVGLDFDTVMRNLRDFRAINDAMGNPALLRIHMTAMPRNNAEAAKMRTLDGISVSVGPCDGRGKEGREPHYGSLRTKGPCDVLWNSLIVMTDGTAVMCCQDFSPSVPMGNVFEEGVEGVFNNAKYTKCRALHQRGWKTKIPMCADCWVTY